MEAQASLSTVCGQVVCWTCSQRSFLIPSYHDSEPDRPARACDRCYDSVFPPETAEEAEAAATATEGMATTGADSVEMSSAPSTSTDDSVSQTLGAFRIGASDTDTDAEGAHRGSPITPPVERDFSAAEDDAESNPAAATSQTAYMVAGRSALAKKSAPTIRPKSLRFETLPPAEMAPLQEGSVSPTTSSPRIDGTAPTPQPASPPQAERRSSTSARTSPYVRPNPRNSQHAPNHSPRPPTRPPAEPRIALEAHHLFTAHNRTSQISAASSGSGTFRLVTPRLTTPESELAPGMGSRSIMDAGYFGAVPEENEEEVGQEG